MALAFSTRIGDLNWLFLVEVIIIVIVVIFYLFYFGRVIASIVSLGLRALIWRKTRTWVEIGSIQLSPLGGRLLVRDVRYVGHNQTVRVAMGHITWRYWLWRVRQDDDLRKEDDRLPCRTTIVLEGVEWFVYNRSPAFDLILERMGHREAKSNNGKHDKGSDSGSVRILPPTGADAGSDSKRTWSLDWLREALPIEVHIVKGAVVFGNRATPSLMVAGFQSAAGTCGLVAARSKLDVYKQVFQFKFKRPKIVFRQNHDYEGPMLEHGKRMQREKDRAFGIDAVPQSTALSFFHFQSVLGRARALAQGIYDIRPAAQTDAASDWRGLPRYRAAIGTLYDDNTPETAQDLQYGKVSTLYDGAESIDLTYYSDIPGIVPPLEEQNTKAAAMEKPDIGNGDYAPEWGVDLRLNGGVLTYGPWSDRQRGSLQETLFPPTFFVVEPKHRLKPGQTREHTFLKIYAEFGKSVTFRLPTREPSKDWAFEHEPRVSAATAVSKRPYGWLDLTIGQNSSVSYVSPNLAGPDGYEAMLEVHLDEIAIASSVTSEEFMKAKLCRISCQLPAPLVWDDPRTWVISVQLEKPVLSLLREHMFLFTDIVRDWTSGPPADYDHFVPYLYRIKLKMIDVTLNLYLNEQNIVSNAKDLSENTILTTITPRLQINVDVPSYTYRPSFSTVTSDIEAERIVLAMHPASWNTHSAWKTQSTQDFAKAEKVMLHVAHTVYAKPQPDQIESVAIDCDIEGILFQLHGWIIKYLMNLKDNYFGSFSRYVSAEEFRRPDHVTTNPNAVLEQKYRPGKSDVFEVTLNLRATRAVGLVPQELHDCQSALALDIPAFGVFLRNHDFAMEMNLSTDPIVVTVVDEAIEVLVRKTLLPNAAATRQLRIDGLSISTHRLFGPQPKTSVYVAVWAFEVGEITGGITIPYIGALLRALQYFAINFADKENALPPEYGVAVDPDVTFLSMSCPNVDVTVWTGDTCVNFVLPQGMSVRLDDIATSDWSSHLDVRVPHFECRGLIPAATESIWNESVGISGGVHVAVGNKTASWASKYGIQQAFLRDQDRTTHRAAFLYGLSTDTTSRAGGLALVNLEYLLKRLTASTPSARTASNKRRHASQSDVPRSPEPASLAYEGLLRQFAQVNNGSSKHEVSGVKFLTIQSGIHPDDGVSQASSNLKSQMREPDSTSQLVEDGKPLSRIHILATRPFFAIASPAGKRIADNVVTALEKHDRPQRWLDRLESSYVLSQMKATRLVKGKPALYATAHISTMTLALVQDVLRPGDIDNTQSLSSGSVADAAIVSSTDINIRQLSAGFLYQQTFPIATADYVMHGSAAQLGMRVKHVGDKTSYNMQRHVAIGLPDSPLGTALEAEVRSLAVSFQQNRLGFDVDIGVADVSLNFVDTAAELVTGTIHSWFVVSREIEYAVVEAEYRPPGLYRRFLVEILQLAQNDNILTDPMFLFLPTVMPIDIRRDFGWRLLGHIRGCMTLLSPASSERLRNMMLDKRSQTSEHQDLVDLQAQLESWNGMDMTAAAVPVQPLFAGLFPKTARECALQQSRLSMEVSFPSADTNALSVNELPDTREGESTKQRSANFHIDMLRAGFFGDDSVCRNKVELDSLKVYALLKGHAVSPKTSKTALFVAANIGRLTVLLDPSFFTLVGHVGRVRRVFEVKLAPFIPRPQPLEPSGPYKEPQAVGMINHSRHTSIASRLDVRILANMSHLDFRSEYRDIVLEAGLRGLHCAMSRSAEYDEAYSKRIDPAFDIFVGFDQSIIECTATETSHIVEQGDSQKLASLTVMGFHAACVVVSGTDVTGLRLSCALESGTLELPRSILRMSQFIRYWQAELLTQSKTEFEILKRDLEGVPRPLSQPHSDVQPKIITTYDISLLVVLPSLSARVRGGPKFWLNYELLGSVCDGRMSWRDSAPRNSDGKARLGSMSIWIEPVITEATEVEQLNPFALERISLPTVMAVLKQSGKCVEVTASLDRIKVTLDVNILDTVLYIAKRLQSDLEDILNAISARKQQPKISASSAPSAIIGKGWAFSAAVALRGLQLGLNSPAATQIIGADLVDVTIKRKPEDNALGIKWEVSADNLALSLEDGQPDNSKQNAAYPLHTSDQQRRLANFVLDLKASNVDKSNILDKHKLPVPADTVHLHLRLPKIHAVMYATAAEALDGVFDHYRKAITAHNEAHAKEIAQLKAKLVAALPLPDKPAVPKLLPFAERCVFSLHIDEIGIAVPLANARNEVERFGVPSQAGAVLPAAFLLSITDVFFMQSKKESGKAKVDDLDAKFVLSFDQTCEKQFKASEHPARNGLRFRSTEIDVKSDEVTSRSTNFLSVRAKTSGAELNIDSSIFEHIYQLIESYEEGYQVLSRHTAGREGSAKLALDPEGNDAVTAFLDTTKLDASLVVDAGRIRVHPSIRVNQSDEPPDGSLRQRSRHRSSSASRPDTFIIPKFSMTAVKRDAYGNRLNDIIHLDAKIHTSRNVLQPSLIPFIRDAIRSVNEKLLQSALQSAEAVPPLPPATALAELKSLDTEEKTAAQPLRQGRKPSNLCWSFQLAIEQSELVFECEPAAQVDGLLNWQGGSLLATWTRASGRLELLARIEEVAFIVRHKFERSTTDVALSGRAYNLICSASLNDKPSNKLGVVNIGSINGTLDISRYNELLCFMSVWLTGMQIPVQLPTHKATTPVKAATSILPSDPTHAYIIRLGEAAFECRCSSIGTIKVCATNMVSRTRYVPTISRSVDVDMQSFTAVAAGQVTGTLHVNGMYFVTKFADEVQYDSEGEMRRLQLGLKIGRVSLDLSFEDKQVLLARIDPIRIGVADDWSQMSTEGQLRLDFSTHIDTSAVLGTAQMLPAIFGLKRRITNLLEEQRRAAHNRLELARLVNEKPNVARTGAIEIMSNQPEQQEGQDLPTTALLPTPLGIPPGTCIVGNIDFKITGLRVALFNGLMNQSKGVHGEIQFVSASLRRWQEAEGTVHRETKFVSGILNMRIINPVVASANQSNGHMTLEESLKRLPPHKPNDDIITIPTLQASMQSRQLSAEPRVVFTFRLSFAGGFDVTFNYAHILTVGDLKKDYVAAFQRAETHASGAKSTSSIAVAAGPLPKPEGMQVVTERVDTDRSATDVMMSNGIEFVPLQAYSIELKLKMLGDATPSFVLERQKKHLPIYLHMLVTLNLEFIINQLCDLYNHNLGKFVEDHGHQAVEDTV